MKLLSETKALERLESIRTEFGHQLRGGYEHKAKSCSTCTTPGVCCLDAHFVNVRISRLEAVAVRKRLNALAEGHRERVYQRVEEAIEKFHLTDTGSQTYACPLYEKGIGCLVHETAKPLPCIAHACYEKKEDLPPDELLAEREIEVDKLNRRVYGKSETLLPIPVALMR